MIWLSQITGWGYSDLMDMDAGEMAWWVDQAVDLEKFKAKAARGA